MKVNTSKKHELLIERLCETFGALYQGNVIDKSWLCETFGITERTAYRDLARLSHLLDEVSTGRYKLNPLFLPSLHIGHLAEFASFAGVAHLFPHNDGKSLRDQMKNADNIKIQGSSSRDNHQFSSLMDKLDNAITAHRVISCNYRSKSRFIQPYRLINHYGLWYLAGVDEDSLKAFELARLEQLAVTDKPFCADPSVIKELNETTGIRFGKRTEATLWVSAHASAYVTRRPLFPGQRITQTHPDGSLTLITDVSDQHTLFRWLRYWLPDIRILSPVSLKEAFSTDFHTRATTYAENDAG